MKTMKLAQPITPQAAPFTDKVVRSVQHRHVGTKDDGEDIYRSIATIGLGRAVGGKVVPDETTFKDFWVDGLDLDQAMTFDEVVQAIEDGHQDRESQEAALAKARQDLAKQESDLRLGRRG